MFRHKSLSLAIAAFLFFMPGVSHAQKEKITGPYIDYVFPAGGQRGTTVEATVAGQNLKAMQSLRVSGKGVIGSITKAVDDNNLEVSLTLAADVEPGERELRLVGPMGASNRFRFHVGQFPEVKEIEPNSTKAQAQKLDALPVMVNGQLAFSRLIQNKPTPGGGDVDFYRFPAKAGQTLVIKVDAQSLLPLMADAVPGWNDALLTLYDGAGKEIASADDYRLHPDPVLFLHVPKDGEYMVSVRDVIYRGRLNFIYRLTIGAIPYITDVYPLGGKRGTTAKVELTGVNLQKKSLDVALAADSPARRSIQLTKDGIVSNALPFAVGDLPEVEEKEPNDTAEQAMRVEMPVTINGRIQKAGDEDFFVFSAKAKQQVVLEVTARRLGSPLDSMLTLINPKGEEVAEDDDSTDPSEGLATHHADSRIVYTIPADGDYTVRLRDIQDNGGPEYAYRLTIAPVQPDFYLNISPDNPQMGQSDTTGITISAIRKDGFNGEIKLQTQDLPKGFVASDAVLGPGQNSVIMTLTSPADVPKGFYAPTIVGTAIVGEQTMTRKALPAEERKQAFAFMHTVPTQELFFSVVDPPRFTLSVKLPGDKKFLEVSQGGEAALTVKVVRNPEPEPKPEPKEQPKPEPKSGAKPGAKPASKPASKPPAKPDPNEGRIDIAGARLPPPPAGMPQPQQTVKVGEAAILPGNDEVEVKIRAEKNAKPDIVQNVIIAGTGKFRGEQIVRIAPAVPVRVLPVESTKPEAKK